MSDWTELSEQLRILQEEFLLIVQNLEDYTREREEVCGHWSPKQVVAHLSAWDKEVSRQFDLFQCGLDKAIEHDIDEFNKNAVLERDHLSWNETVDELKTAHKLFRLKVDSISPEELSRNAEYMEWMNVQIEHYIHHIEQLKKRK